MIIIQYNTNTIKLYFRTDYKIHANELSKLFAGKQKILFSA